ncbi:DEKNAAC104377 [Brettanomyces naardenensis]|uniref:DEKNAAC104377 n=1 Tax=Brettanomyces naardenensis TaxID=13370 RepID=A0A448YQM7_BRENA|nr:DEKNAAC104377 [Brettanomyces naardenensis]
MSEEIIEKKESVHTIVSKGVGDTEAVRIDHWYDGFVRLFIWYPPYLPKDEKRLLLKVDFFILVYVCASYFTKALDKSNITNAYVTGMKEEINFGGNDLAYSKSLYSAGYIVSMCCGVMFVTRPWARFMLPVLETIWGVLTFCQAAVKTPSQMYALRFLIGLAEGPIFPSIVYTLGSWYKRDEVYRRVMVFSISSSLGGMFSGFLQSAAYTNLSGKGGLSGWKWGFIIDGIFTVPIALFGFVLFPGTVEQAGKVFWLKPHQWELAKSRMRQSGVREPTKLSLELVKRVFLRWHVHYFTAFWVLLNVVALPDGLGFPLWLKANYPERYSETNVNNYPSIQSAVGVVAQFVLAGLSDSFSIYPFLSITQILFIISYSSLAAWNIPIGYRWFCFMIVGFDSVNQSIVSGQINRSCRRDAEERAFVLGFSDAVSQAMNIWTNIVFYPTEDAPKFHLGYIISTVAAVIMLFMPILSWYGDRWDEKVYGNGVVPVESNENDSSDPEAAEVVAGDETKLL